MPFKQVNKKENQLVQNVAKMLQQGQDPKQVLQLLVKNGIPQKQAIQLVQGVMQQMHQETPQQEQQEPAQMQNPQEEQQEMQQGGLIPLPQSIKPPIPNYNFSIFKNNPNYYDSALYKGQFNAILNSEPNAIYNQLSYQRYGVPTTGVNGGKPDMSIYSDDVSRRNAYDDASSSQLRFLQNSTMQDLSRYKQNSIPKKQMGGGTPINTIGRNTELDTMPSYLYYAKAAQMGNQDGMNLALKHVQDARGSETATDLRFLGNDLKFASLNDIAKRNVSKTQNPQMKQFYQMVNENPDLINHFDMSMPMNNDIAKQNTLKRKGGMIKSKMNPYC